MHMSRSKCPLVQPYKLCGFKLEVIDSHPYLGVQLQNDLGWNTHIDYICNKANRTLGILCRNLHGCSTKLKLQSYTTLVHPIVEYNAAAWDPHTKRNLNKLEMVQWSAVRYVDHNYERVPGTVTALLNKYGLDMLESR